MYPEHEAFPPAAATRPCRASAPTPRPKTNQRCSDAGADAGTGAEGGGRFKNPHCVTTADERRFLTVAIGGCGWLLPPAVSKAAVWLWQLRALCLLPPAARAQAAGMLPPLKNGPVGSCRLLHKREILSGQGPSPRPSSRYAPSYRAQTARHAKFHSKKKKKIGRSTPPLNHHH